MKKKLMLIILNNSLLIVCLFFAIVTINEYQIYKRKKLKTNKLNDNLNNAVNMCVQHNEFKANGTKNSKFQNR
jgi:hypothetical protein